MIAYYTRFRTAPENRSKLVDILLRASAAMAHVEGCRLYNVSLDATDEGLTNVAEMWSDEAAHDVSLQLPEAKELIAEAMPHMTSAPEQSKLGPVVSSWIE